MKPAKSGKARRDLNNLTPEQCDARRKALKNMLDSNVTRHQRAAQERPPVLTPGRQVAIIDGEFAGRHGIVLDADFISSQVQLDISDQSQPQWIAFANIGHV